MPVYPSIRLSIYLPGCLSVCLSVLGMARSDPVGLLASSSSSSSSSGMIGESMGFVDSQTLEEITNCEEQIKRRVPRGERVSLQAIENEMVATVRNT